MRSGNISSHDSVQLNELQDGARTVLYEEMAEYYYLFARKKFLNKSSLQLEVNYHIGNLVLLSFYFDVVLIQTSTIFNTSDQFVKKVIDNVLIHPTFKSMLETNVLKIVGWGGTIPKDMFESAKSFSLNADVNADINDNRFSIISEFFNPQNVVSRSSVTPDSNIELLFKKRLDQTTVIRRPEDILAIDFALNKSIEKTGQLVAVSFNPELEKLELSSKSIDSVGVSFIQSWYDHLSHEIPGVTTYSPIISPVFIDQKQIISNNSVRTFLYSPQIFASFLGGYLCQKDFNTIMSRPFYELHKIKNGDWKRFSSAYHEAIFNVSENISFLNSDLYSFNELDSQSWGDKLTKAIENNSDKVDVNAYIEGLAMLSGVVFTLPFLTPIFKLAGVAVGKKLNDTFHSVHKNATTDVSPFIKKLQMHYDLEGANA